jgi:O-succinylbenzoic acid--CoA ligase
MTPWLVERAQRDPDELALCADGIRITWEELARRVDTLARRLGALGLVRGDRVALLMEPSARFVELVHAAQRLELTLVPLSTRAAAPELAALLAHAEPALVLHDHAHAGGLAGGAGRTCEAAAALDAVAPAAPRPSAPVDLDAVATILYTSGTTGRAKGVMLTHGNHRASAAASRARLGARPDDRWLCPLPLFHVGGLSIVLRSVLDGTPLVLHPRFDARAVWEALATERITLLSLVPTMVHRLLAEADTAPTTRAAPALRCVLVGGAACDGALHARARAHGLPIVATYGLTEAASQVATAAPSDPHELVGTPVPGTTVRIAEPDAHGRGEIVVAGPTVMAGYFRDADATAAALRGGWLHTGDVGHLDDAGRLQVLDRRTDLVVTGGENVYPTEVETVLRAHPDVADAAVFGVRDAEWGRCVHAAVVPRAAGVFDEAALRRWCRDRLAGFKTPRTIVMVDALPRTASGKLRRSVLAR